eukprot:PhF_6_TR23805/c0_g1_i1/m.33332
MCTVCFAGHITATILSSSYGLAVDPVENISPSVLGLQKKAKALYLGGVSLAVASALTWATVMSYFGGLPSVVVFTGIWIGGALPKSLHVFNRRIKIYQLPHDVRLVRILMFAFKYGDGFSDLTVGIILFKTYTTNTELLIACIVIILSLVDFPILMMQLISYATPPWLKHFGRFSEIVILALTLFSTSSSS